MIDDCHENHPNPEKEDCLRNPNESRGGVVLGDLSACSIKNVGREVCKQRGKKEEGRRR